MSEVPRKTIASVISVNADNILVRLRAAIGIMTLVHRSSGERGFALL